MLIVITQSWSELNVGNIKSKIIFLYLSLCSLSAQRNDDSPLNNVRQDGVFRNAYGSHHLKKRLSE